MQQIIEQLESLKIVPVVVMNDASRADGLADALVAGGLPCAEVTFRTAAAADSIKAMAKRGDLLVGAGTVLSIDQVKEAVDSGASFIVAPGLNSKVAGYCVDNNIPITPGAVTPTEIDKALELGIDVVKFFPAETFGGLSAIKAISAPYTGVRFIPTGGINAANIAEYLAHPKVVACGGSWMVKKDLIESGQFDEITRLTREAVSIAQSS